MSNGEAGASAKPRGAFWLMLDAVNNLVKSVAWPMIVIYVLYAFHEPLTDIGKLLPSKLAAANKVSAGGLTFEIERTAQAAGNPELGKLIGGLSRSALEILLRTGNNASSIMSTTDSEDRKQIQYNIPSATEIAALKQLERAGLLDPGKSIDDWENEVKAKLEFLENMGDRDAYVAGNGQRRLDDAVEQGLWDAQYRLSDLGRTAVDLIIESVTQELQKPVATAAAD